MYSKLDIQINRTIYLIKKMRKILLVGHKKPDSDAIGAAVALGLFLQKFKKEVIMSSYETPPSRFDFLTKNFKFLYLEEAFAFEQDIDLIITLDCGSFGQTGLENKFFTKPNIFLINIDHHYDNTNFGALNIIQEKASSTCEIVYEILQKLGGLIDKKIATALLCGIFGDTDSFKNPNTTEKTLQYTSLLLSQGADLKEIIKNTLQDKSVAALHLWGKVLSRLQKHKKLGLVYTIVTHEDVKENKNYLSDLEGIANFLNSIPEAKASLVLVEKENGEIKGSLRTLSKTINIAKLAHLFGGGGHKKAAGFTIPGKLVKKENGWGII
jgi:phosphoesterase RecJ-like protein